MRKASKMVSLKYVPLTSLFRSAVTMRPQSKAALSQVGLGILLCSVLAATFSPPHASTRNNSKALMIPTMHHGIDPQEVEGTNSCCAQSAK